MKSLINHYTKTPVTSIHGPFTLVTGKNRRITFMEVENNINAMIDAAKVADLILLMIDGSYGFEMEVFEMLNICQVHGMPKIMGVLSHLDLIKKEASLKRIKKVLKHRFWTEVYDVCFYFIHFFNDDFIIFRVQNCFIFLVRLTIHTYQVK